MYISSNSRPDNQFSVNHCASFSHNPRRSHYKAVNRICRYLVVSQGQVLTLDHNSNMDMDCYVDTDFSRLFKNEYDQYPVCVKSRTGHVMSIGGCTLHWVSKIQTYIELSTLEDEYIDIAQAMRNILPLR